MSRERHEYDYYYNGQFLFHLGRIQYRKAHPPLPIHVHKDQIEFVYLEKGQQKYLVEGQIYTLNPGEVFFTKPNEMHSTGITPEEVSSFYYMIIDLHLLSTLHLFLSTEEYEKINRFFSSEKRICKASETLLGAFKNLFKCFTSKDEHFDTHVRNALSEILIAVSTPYKFSKKTTELTLERSLRFIDEHSEDNIHVSDLAQIEKMSLSTYHKCFSKLLGISPAEYVLKMKVEKTKELLQKTDMTITEIAYQYGFSSSQYFSTVFKRFCYVTPTEYRKDSSR